MVEVVVLGSGSKGNATLVRTATSSILVDAGFSAKQLELRLGAVGQDPAAIDAVFVTHEHSDHVQGLRVFTRRHGVPVFANDATIAACGARAADVPEIIGFEAGATVSVRDFTVTSFTIPHDAADPMAFVIEAEGHRIGHATDLGHVTGLVRLRLADCDALVLEANHDRGMLMEGPYPWATKQRVASRLGHLSNDMAAELVTEIVSERTRGLVLAHLSETNNHPYLAEFAVKNALDGERSHCTMQLARQEGPASPLVL
jgi:phosphoribosyl 1,2-cyclic phosphodiesterase